MGQRVPLAAAVTVGADGTATAVITQQLPGVVVAQRIAVNVSTPSTTSSVCRLYRELVADNTYLQGTSSGDGDVDTQPSLELATGESLVAYWTGAAPNATAFIHFEGKLSDD